MLFSVCIGDTVHIIAGYHLHRSRGTVHHEAMVETMREVFIPCLFTSLTTMMGFLSFLTTDIIPIRMAGIYSAIGVAIARTAAEYKASVEEAFRYEDEILVEEYIEGRELTCGMVGGQALPCTEIIPREGFYDYAHKYQPGWTEEITPARVSDADMRRMQELTLRACDTLHLAVYARADFLLAADGRLYCLEVNTLPGMTPTSLLPQGAAAAGIDYPTLCDRLVSLSMRKYQ